MQTLSDNDTIAFGPCPTCGTCVQVIAAEHGPLYRPVQQVVPTQMTSAVELPVHWGDVNLLTGREHGE